MRKLILVIGIILTIVNSVFCQTCFNDSIIGTYACIITKSHTPQGSTTTTTIWRDTIEVIKGSSGNNYIMLPFYSSTEQYPLNAQCVYYMGGGGAGCNSGYRNWEFINNDSCNLDYGGQSWIDCSYTSYKYQGNKLPVVTGVRRDLKKQFYLLPNPNNGEFKIHLGNESVFVVFIINLLGETVYCKTHTNDENIIQLNGVMPEVYMVRCKSETKEHFSKIIIN